jgi:hypothetical protein
VIPQNRIDPIAARIVDLYPLPNISGRENLANNFFAAPGRPTDADQLDFRVDHQITSNNRMFARYSLRDEEQKRPGPFKLPAGENGGDLSDLRGNALTAGLSSVLTNKVHNEFRFGWTFFDTGLDVFATENLNEQFGITGAVGTQFGQHDRGLARFFPSGYSFIGSSCCWPNDDELLIYQFNDNVLWQAGKHTIKFGIQYHRLDKLSLSAVDNRGTFNFNGQYSAQFPNQATSRAATGNGLADFMLGMANGGRSSAPAGEHIIYNNWGLYFQDDWKITRKLTWNIGLRWEVFAGPNWPPKNQVASRIIFKDDPNYKIWDNETVDTLNPEFVEWTFPDGGCGCQLDKDNFAPRMGLAYQVAQNTVIRAGAGIYYGNVDYIGIEDGRFWGNNPAGRPVNIAIPNVETAVYSLGTGAPQLQAPFAPDELPLTLAWGIPEYLDSPYTAQWFLDVQHMLPWDIVMSVGYNGTSSSHLPLPWGRNANAPLGPHPTQNAFVRRRFAGLTNFLKYDNIANANYNAMVFRLEKRFSDGVTFLNSFTWQKGMDYGTEWLTASEAGGFGNRPNEHVKDLHLARAESAFNRRLAYSLSFMWELPFGPNRNRLQSGPASWILGGWQLGGILSMQSGPPISHSMFPGGAHNCACRPMGDLVGDPNLPESQRTVERWFNTDAFQLVDPGSRLGFAGRGLIDGPGWKNLDFSAVKNFYMPWEGHYFQFRFESFNLTNTAHFGGPLSTNIGLAGRGAINAGDDPRLIQFALRYVF